MKIKKGFILYFDILGYKSIVTGNKEKILMRCFSDNFLFLYESRSFYECDTQQKKLHFLNDFINIKAVGSQIQQEFLEQGILTRGSLSFGEIEYNDYIVFDKSIVNAVVLEESHSEPSFVIDDNLRRIVNEDDKYNAFH